MSVELIHKTFSVLEVMGAAPGPLALREIAGQADLPKPTAYRILQTLVECGYAAQDGASGHYLLTARLASLGRKRQYDDLIRTRLPFMARLHEAFNENVNLAVLQGDQVHYVHYLETTRPLRRMIEPNVTDPYYVSSLGRAIVAFLPEDEREHLVTKTKFRALTPKTVRTKAELRAVLARALRDGWAEDDEEGEEGICCLGVPILEDGYPVAAMSVTMPRSRFDPARKEKIVAELLLVARKMNGKTLQATT